MTELKAVIALHSYTCHHPVHPSLSPPRTPLYDALLVPFSPGPRAPFGVPVWNPFLNLLGTSFRYRIRPVPVVFLRLAFSPQLSAFKQVNMPQVNTVGVAGLTLSDLGRGVAARGAGVLLDVERATT